MNKRPNKRLALVMYILLYVPPDPGTTAWVSRNYHTSPDSKLTSIKDGTMGQGSANRHPDNSGRIPGTGHGSDGLSAVNNNTYYAESGPKYYIGRLDVLREKAVGIIDYKRSCKINI